MLDNDKRQKIQKISAAKNRLVNSALQKMPKNKKQKRKKLLNLPQNFAVFKKREVGSL